MGGQKRAIRRGGVTKENRLFTGNSEPSPHPAPGRGYRRGREDGKVGLASVTDIGPGHTVEEQTIGLIVVGLIGVVLVAVVRILTSYVDRK